MDGVKRYKKMSELNTISFPDFVALANKIWLKGANSVVNAMRDSGFVEVMSIPENTGNTRSFSEIDTNEYMGRKGEDDEAARGIFQQGYSKTLTTHRIAENVGISYEMRTQNKYNEVLNRLLAAGQKGYKSMDLDLTHRITFGTATSYVDRDGVTVDISTGDALAVFSTVHKLTGSATTYRNILANNPRVSKGSLEAMERMIVENSYSNLGEKKSLSYDIIFSTDDPNTVNTIREYLQSTSDVEGAHNGIINVYNSKYRHVILPRLATDANGNIDTDKRYYWGLASSQQMPIKLGVWEEPHLMSPQANGNSEDVQTDAWEFRNRAGYGVTTPSGRGITLSKGDASA